MSRRKKKGQPSRKREERRRTTPADNNGESTITISGLDSGRESTVRFSEECRQAGLAIISDKSKLKEDIDSRVAELLKSVDGYDPLWILGDLSARFYLRLGDDLTPASPEAAGAPKYFASLLLACEWPADVKTPDASLLNDLIEKYKLLALRVSQFYMPTVGPQDDPERTLQYLFRLNTLHVQGKFYWPIARRYFEGLAQEVDPILTGSLGIGIADVIGLLARAEEATSEKLDREMADLRVLREGHAKFKEFIDDPDSRLGAVEETRAAYLEWLPADLRTRIDAAVARLHSSSPAECFELDAQDEGKRRIVDHLSVAFGENKEFLDRFLGWPLSPSKVPEKPFIEHEGRYYLLPAGAAFQDFDEIVNGVVDGLPEPERAAILKKRDRFLETTAADVLKRVFGSDSVYENLHYPIGAPGADEDAEVDAIVVFGDAVLAIEAKAGRLHAPSKRGSVEKIRKDVSELMAQGYQQGLRVKAYIDACEKAEFTDSHGRKVLEVERDKVRHFYVVNVTNDPLFPVQADPKHLEHLGLVASPGLLVSLSIFDLLVIEEILERPSLVLHYLYRRARMSQEHAIEMSDEMNALGLYVSGKLAMTNRMRGLDLVVFDGAGQAIDRYYYLLETTKALPKPRVTLPEKFDSLVRCIEECQSDVKGTALLMLLEAREKLRKKVAYKEREAISKSKTRTIRETVGSHGLVLMIHGQDWDDSMACAEADRMLDRTGISDCVVIHWAPELPDTEVDVRRVAVTS